jgi:hypothetical protein
MTDRQSDFERVLMRRLAEAAPAAAPGALESLRLAIVGVPQRNPWHAQVAGAFANTHWMKTAATGAVLAALVVGLAVGREAPRVGNGPFLSPSPSPPGTPLVWTPDRAQMDWPLPVRVEVPGPPVWRTLQSDSQLGTFPSDWFADLSGDVGPSAPGWLDITTVRVHYRTGDPSAASRVEFSLVTQAPSNIPDPRDQWVAYGLVVDVDEDGQPDLRLGMDNAPGRQHRAWWTDLATGITKAQTGPPYGAVGDTYFDTFLPGEKVFGRLNLRAQDVGAFKFYVWASLIEGGRVVATDYAPDVGWVDPGDGTAR